ncbi:MAG: hypothetical protein O2946_10000, partial [Planctomycetota bacterium]|nr:hypothetical protein [Planctomycetota bacterium]
QPLAGESSTAESPLKTVWQGVQSVAAWAGVEPVAAQPVMVTEQGGQQATQAGGPLPEGSSWFAAPRPTASSGGMTANTPMTAPPSAPAMQPPAAVPGGYRVGTQSPLPQRW